MEKLTAAMLADVLAKIDPTKRLRWFDGSSILRAIDTPEAERAWLDWSAPLALTDEVIELWRSYRPPPCADPLAELSRIAKRRGER